MKRTPNDSSGNRATRLFDAGFHDIISVIPPNVNISPYSKISPSQAGKVPGTLGRHGWRGFPGWQKHPSAKEDAAAWDESGSNVGLRGDRFPAIDVDVEDPDLAALIVSLCIEQLGHAPIRSSRHPRQLLPYRTEAPFRKKALQFESGGQTHVVEILGEGNQYLVAGTHTSGNPYSWDSPLWEMVPEDLSEITESDIEELFETLEGALGKRGIVVQRKGGKKKRRKKAQKGQTAKASPDGPQQDEGDFPEQDSLLAPSLEVLGHIVGMIPNSSKHFPHYDDYIAMAIAIHAASGGEGLEIFQEWASRWRDSQRRNDPAQVECEWDSLSPPFRIGFERLQRFARELGDYDWAADEFGLAEHDPFERAVHATNNTYAVVQIGSDVCILQERGEEIRFMRPSHFELKLKPHSVPVGAKKKKWIPLSKAWLEWPGRREYDRVVFKPGVADTRDDFNLWRGWAVEPSAAGDCTLFLSHLKEVVCDGDEDHFNWLLDWMADMIQNPMSKPGIAVALQGGQGAGKSIVGATMKAILGKHQTVADQPGQVTGRFNAHLEYCLLLQSEEAFWAGGKSDVGRLKNLVTGETIRIERKGIDSVEVPSYTRLLITSNEDWVWPADIDDRRLVIFRVSNKHVGDRQYFHRLVEQLENGGYGKLLHTLQARAIDGWTRRESPLTDAFMAQVSESLTSEMAWTLKLLEAAELYRCEVLSDGSVQVALAVLYDSYVTSLEERRYMKSEEAFAFFIRDVLRAETTNRRIPVNTGRRGGVRSTLYRLPPVQELREWYSRSRRGAPQKWGDRDTWVEEAPAPDFVI